MISRAIVFEQANKAALVEQELPDTPPGGITVAATVSLISTGTEMICYHGACDADTHWAEYAKYPNSPGYSLVGRVAQLGEGVDGLQIGQRVSVTASHRSHVNVEPKHVWGREIPDDIPDEDAVWASLAVITQTGVRMAEHSMGDTAAVIGLGPLGQLVVQYLRILGCSQIIAVDPVQARLDMALDHGATAAFCGAAADARQFVVAHTGNRLADVVYEVTGHWAVLPTALPLARDHGKLILLGDSPHPSKQHLTYDVLSRQVRIIGSRSSWLPPEHASWTPQRMTDFFFACLQKGLMRVSDLITHRFTPEEAPQAYEGLSQDRSGTMGVIFDWRTADG